MGTRFFLGECAMPVAHSGVSFVGRSGTGLFSISPLLNQHYFLKFYWYGTFFKSTVSPSSPLLNDARKRSCAEPMWLLPCPLNQSTLDSLLGKVVLTVQK